MTKRYLGMDELVGEGESVIQLGAYAAAQTDSNGGFTGYTSHFGPLAVNGLIDQLSAVNTAYIYSIALSRPTSVSQIFACVTTAFGGAGTEVKYGLWKDNGHGWPGQLIASGTEAVGAAVTGPIIHTINPAIICEPGIYYAGMEAKDAGLKLYGANLIPSLMGYVHGAGSPILLVVQGIRATITYASFPPSPYSDSGNVPIYSSSPYPTTFLTGVYL